MENNTNPPETNLEPLFTEENLERLEQLNVRLTSVVIDWLYDLMRRHKRMHRRKILARENIIQILLELLMKAELDWSEIDSKEALKKVLEERGWR